MVVYDMENSAQSNEQEKTCPWKSFLHGRDIEKKYLKHYFIQLIINKFQVIPVRILK